MLFLQYGSAAIALTMNGKNPSLVLRLLSRSPTQLMTKFYLLGERFHLGRGAQPAASLQ